MPYHFAPLTIVLGGAAVDKRVAGLGDLDGVKIGVEGGTLSDTILMTYGDGRLIDEHHAYGPRAEGNCGLNSSVAVSTPTLVPLHRFDAYRAEHRRHQIAGVGLSLSRSASTSDSLDSRSDAGLARRTSTPRSSDCYRTERSQGSRRKPA